MLNVIDYVPGASLLHRMNPVSKLALAASIILATFLSQSWAMLVGLLMLTLALGAYAGVITRLVSLLKVLTRDSRPEGGHACASLASRCRSCSSSP